MKMILRALLPILLVLVVSINAIAQAKDENSIRGQVVNASGKGISGAEVVLVKRDKWARSQNDVTYHTISADKDGNFDFGSEDFTDAWILARYRLEASKPWVYTESASFKPIAAKEFHPISFTKNSPQVTGQVLDECNHPVTGATVAVLPKPGHCFTTPPLMEWDGKDATERFIYQDCAKSLVLQGEDG